MHGHTLRLVELAWQNKRKRRRQIEMKLLVKCNICGKEEVINGQRQYDKEWAPQHRHEDRQTEMDYKIGKNFEMESGK